MKPANRLYVTPPLSRGDLHRLDREQSHYVSRVLRLRSGDGLVLFDGNGGEYDAVIAEMARDRVSLTVGEHRAADLESPLAVWLLQGLSRGERMDFVVQKATELGVHRITPVLTEFSVVRLEPAKSGKRVRHWEKVAQSACEQCGRNVVPRIDPPQPLSRWLEQATMPETVRVVLDPGAAGRLASLDHHGSRVELLIGPEGGLSTAEARQAAAAGFVPCSLGPRILRTETAALAALTVLQARLGDLG
jgi:16S rRNA (uracil1498-N3)-methyltransferase